MNINRARIIVFKYAEAERLSGLTGKPIPTKAKQAVARARAFIEEHEQAEREEERRRHRRWLSRGRPDEDDSL